MVTKAINRLIDYAGEIKVVEFADGKFFFFRRKTDYGLGFGRVGWKMFKKDSQLVEWGTVANAEGDFEVGKKASKNARLATLL